MAADASVCAICQQELVDGEAVVAWLCWFVVRLCWLSGAGLCALRRLLCGALAVLFVAA